VKALPVVCMLLTLVIAKPGVAGGGGIVLWNDGIAAALNDVVMADAVCRYTPGRGLNHHCFKLELNRSRTPFVVVTLLDEIVLMIDRYANPAVGGTIARGASFEFAAHSTNLFTEGIEARLSLKIEW
jgi:hypothetical protein